MRKLITKPNVKPADSDFPYGRIKDNPGNGTGTPVNEEVYGDMHQFFEKLMAMSSITPNDLPDSEYSGYQLIEALKKVCVTSFNTALGLKMKVIRLGAWNMNFSGGGTASKNYAHGLNHDKILFAKVLVKIDGAGTIHYPLEYVDLVTGNSIGGIYRITDTNVEINIIAGGHFDDVAFNDLLIDRGSITLFYFD